MAGWVAGRSVGVAPGGRGVAGGPPEGSEAEMGEDFPLLQAIFLFASAAVIFMNLVADLAYGYFDPRVQEA